MAEGDQVNQGNAGDQGQGGSQRAQSDSLGWRAALPDEYKEHEWAKAHTKVGDFFKAALETKANHDAMKTRLDGAIIKPGENAKPEEVAAYRKAIGVPDKAADYELPTVEGLDNSPEMVTWAQGIFHQVGLSKEQGSAIGKAWNTFVAGMVKAENEAMAKARTEAEAELKKGLGSEEKFKEAVELTSRLLKAHATPEELEFLNESELGNHPTLIKLITRLAQKTGEDTSPQGTGGGAKSPAIGMNYETMDTFRGG